MMFLKYLFLGILGASFGLLAAGGVFTVLISVGLIPRFAGKTHTGKKVFLYEEAVIFGTIAGDVASVFEDSCRLGEMALLGLHIPARLWAFVSNGFLLAAGMFAGMFVGCLALAIAEMLDTIPIFARRIGFRHGLGIAVLAIALGKMMGSLLYFYFSIYQYGG